MVPYDQKKWALSLFHHRDIIHFSAFTLITDSRDDGKCEGTVRWDMEQTGKRSLWLCGDCPPAGTMSLVKSLLERFWTKTGDLPQFFLQSENKSDLLMIYLWILKQCTFAVIKCLKKEIQHCLLMMIWISAASSGTEALMGTVQNGSWFLNVLNFMKKAHLNTGLSKNILLFSCCFRRRLKITRYLVMSRYLKMCKVPSFPHKVNI